MTYLAQFTGTKLMTSEIIGTKAEIEAWVDCNRRKFSGETIRIWPMVNGKPGALLGQRTITA